MTTRYVNPAPGYVYKSGDQIYFFETGTTTPLDTYSDSAGTTANTNPVVVPSTNIVPDIFLSDQDYKVRVDNVDDVTQWTRDPVNFDSSPVPFADWSSSITYSQGDIVTGTNERFYKSLTNSNQGNNPVSDSVNWLQILLPQKTNSYLDPFEGLVIGRPSASTIDLDADTLYLTDSNGQVIGVDSVNVTIDITNSGADGLDTGSETADTTYYIWGIYNQTTSTVAGLLSTSRTSPTLPSGYTYKGLFGMTRNNSSSDLIEFRQRDARVTCRVLVLSGGQATSVTSVDLTPCPDIATKAYVDTGIDNSSAATSRVLIREDTTQEVIGILNNPSTANELEVPLTLPLTTASAVTYSVGSGTQSCDMTLTGWDY